MEAVVEGGASVHLPFLQLMLLVPVSRLQDHLGMLDVAELPEVDATVKLRISGNPGRDVLELLLASCGNPSVLQVRPELHVGFDGEELVVRPERVEFQFVLLVVLVLTILRPPARQAHVPMVVGSIKNPAHTSCIRNPDPMVRVDVVRILFPSRSMAKAPRFRMNVASQPGLQLNARAAAEQVGRFLRLRVAIRMDCVWG